ncbi:hypothetical protein BZK31_01780 [Pseudomonas floridensis]|uniref:Uncharacterized protein n=1 Tax=Pseudomonas floridensis TaxID=1958950 RepID=A0A1X0NC24_9PSED|nr:hypothetical protein BZK31_01780 [Pseudomonas floridensis]
MFCHGFDLFRFTVDPTVNNLGVFSYSPLYTRAVARCSIIVQSFSGVLSGHLSTGRELVVHTVYRGPQPVDKSVGKHWKEWGRRHRDWAVGHHGYTGR